MPEQVIAPASKGASQTAGKWVLQVDTAYDANASVAATPVWVTVFGVNSFTPNLTYTEQPDDDFDSNGWDSSVITGQGWNVAYGVRRKKYQAVYDVGQEFLRRAAFLAKKVHIRWFDRKHGAEAYEGYASSKWEPQGGGRTDLETVNGTLTGDGQLLEIANPHNAIPTITGASPSTTAAAGATVTITGTGFWGLSGTSAVKFGSADATSYIVDSESQIRAVMPAGTSGPANITVTNPIGVSTAFTYART